MPSGESGGHEEDSAAPWLNCTPFGERCDKLVPVEPSLTAPFARRGAAVDSARDNGALSSPICSAPARRTQKSCGYSVMHLQTTANSQEQNPTASHASGPYPLLTAPVTAFIFQKQNKQKTKKKESPQLLLYQSFSCIPTSLVSRVTVHRSVCQITYCYICSFRSRLHLNVLSYESTRQTLSLKVTSNTGRESIFFFFHFVRSLGTSFHRE